MQIDAQKSDHKALALVIRTQIHGCFSASAAVIRLLGFTVSIWLIKFFASGVTVSHSGDGYYNIVCKAFQNESRLNSSAASITINPPGPVCLSVFPSVKRIYPDSERPKSNRIVCEFCP